MCDIENNLLEPVIESFIALLDAIDAVSASPASLEAIGHALLLFVYHSLHLASRLYAVLYSQEACETLVFTDQVLALAIIVCLSRLVASVTASVQVVLQQIKL